MPEDERLLAVLDTLAERQRAYGASHSTTFKLLLEQHSHELKADELKRLLHKARRQGWVEYTTDRPCGWRLVTSTADDGQTWSFIYAKACYKIKTA